jgi:hypothetical protein
MHWFLPLFAEYRAQSALIQSLTAEKLILQDRLDSVMHDRGELWRMMETAISNERATLQMQVNFATQQKFGVTPFPDAVQLPNVSEPNNFKPLTRRQTPSEMIASGTTKFIREWNARQEMKSGPVEEVKD